MVVDRLRFRKSFTEAKCLYLLTFLLLLLAVYPYLEGRTWSNRVLGLFITAVLLSAIYAMSYRRRVFITGLILGLPIILLQLFQIWKPEHTFVREAFHLTVVPFYALVTVTVLNYVLKGDEVTADKIYGAASVYLMMGLTWGTAYNLIHKVNPESFHVNPEMIPEGITRWSDLIYFSFVTLTTLGYGDITPVTSQTRSLAFLEAASGVLYIAILVARLVSMYPGGRSGRPPE